MNCNTQKYAEIVPGSKADFTMVLTDDGKPLNLAAYQSGKLIFKNTAGVRTEIILAVPGINPGSGFIPVTVTAVQSAFADDCWINADLELVELATGQLVVKPFEDKFTIKKRYT
jgi:hypothetical protein